MLAAIETIDPVVPDPTSVGPMRGKQQRAIHQRCKGKVAHRRLRIVPVAGDGKPLPRLCLHQIVERDDARLRAALEPYIGEAIGGGGVGALVDRQDCAGGCVAVVAQPVQRPRHVPGAGKPFNRIGFERLAAEHVRVDRRCGEWRRIVGEQFRTGSGIILRPGLRQCGMGGGFELECLAGGQHRQGAVGIADTDGAQHGTDLVLAKRGEQGVGGGIVTDRDHQRRQRLQRYRCAGRPGLEDAGRQRVAPDMENIVPMALAGGDLARGFGEHPQLERGCFGNRTRKTRAESKLIKLKQSLTDQGVFNDPKMKLLLFTEHKDTLDYLVGKLREWGLTVTQIHGGMKIGDRDTPNSRIFAEREFRETCQVLVATEAAGEGINLQFCWFMINYDIPWNPNRLEQRMGRIHRYGQERDCLIFNFVSTNTREGRVLQKLFERIRAIEDALDPQHTGKVFNVLGDIFPANMLKRMVRDMYAHNNMTEELIKSRIVEQVNPERFRKITSSTLEGLAKRELNLSALIGKSAEAKEHRLIPEIIEDFFLQSSPLIGLTPKEVRGEQHIFRVGRIPRSLWPIGEKLEPRFGRLGHEYKLIAFSKEYLEKDPTLEWVTPGHPLFETVREAAWNQVQDDLERGAVFYDLNRDQPSQMVVFQAAVRDGRGNVLHRRIFVVEAKKSGEMILRQPTVFLDVIPAPVGTPVPEESGLPDRARIEQYLYEKALAPFLQDITREREHENNIIREHLQLSLNELINRQQIRHGDLQQQQINGDNTPLMQANLKQVEERLEELNHRLEQRTAELITERHCTISDIKIVGQAWILPHPDRRSPAMQGMVNDPEIERIAIEFARQYEQSRGWQVTSVESENRGFDLISQRQHPDDPNSIEFKYIEVKGRAGIGEISVTSNEFKTAERLQDDYWLYVVYNCTSRPEIHRVQNPARLKWQAVVQVEHYKTTSTEIIEEREQ